MVWYFVGWWFFFKTRTQKTNNRIDPWLPTNAKLMTTRCQRKRRGEESCTSLRFLARQRARQATPLLSPAVATALLSRWSAMLTHAAFTAYAASVQGLDSSPHTQTSKANPCPSANSSPQDSREDSRRPSRLPAS